MTSVVATFSYEQEKIPVFEEFKKIAARDGKNKSEIIVELVEQYVKYHSEGNDTFKLEKWQDPDFFAIPSLDAPKETWIKCYKNCNEKERTLLRIQAMNLSKWYRMVDVNS